MFLSQLKAQEIDKISTLELLQAIGQLKFRGTSVLLRNQPTIKTSLKQLPYEQHKDELLKR